MDVNYKLIVENAKDAIVIVDDEVIKYINDYGAKKLGYEKKEIVGKNFLDFSPEKEKENLKYNYKKTVEGKDTFLYEMSFVRKDGRVIFTEVRAQNIEYDGKAASLSFIRDVTARKKTVEI